MKRHNVILSPNSSPLWRGLLALTLFLTMCCSTALSLNAQPAKSVSQTNGKKYSLPYITLKKRKYVLLKNLAIFYGLIITPKGKESTLWNKNNKLVFTTNSRIFTFNSLSAHLSYPIEDVGGMPAISSSDVITLLDPILRTGTLKRRTIKTIVIDAGHGGNDPGAQCNNIIEKNLNLAMARRLRAILIKRGYNVILSRSTDVAQTLDQRVQLAAKQSPDLFISMHANAATDKTVNGIEVYVPNPKDTPSSGGNTVAKNATASDAVVCENALLGYLLQKNLLKQTGAADRGFRRKQFLVIRKAACPSALIEIGYASNLNESKKLLDSKYQDKLCVAIADSIQQYSSILAPKKK